MESPIDSRQAHLVVLLDEQGPQVQGRPRLHMVVIGTDELAPPGSGPGAPCPHCFADSTPPAWLFFFSSGDLSFWGSSIHCFLS